MDYILTILEELRLLFSATLPIHLSCFIYMTYVPTLETLASKTKKIWPSNQFVLNDSVW